MNYQEALKYLGSFADYEKVVSFDYKEVLKLERMERFIDQLGNPHRSLHCIHIAGTKGKGSTSAMVASILKKAGYRVGLYTSPHLISFRERIQINDELISEEEISLLLGRIKPVIDEIDKESNFYPTFFEVYTALAFLYFKEKNVDFCVVETGMGGRLDATNIIERPLCCGITQISYEHTQKLGNTLSAIAVEKAGIIKGHSVCVSSVQGASAANVIKKTCIERHCKLYEVSKDISFREEGFNNTGENQVFFVSGIFQDYPSLELCLLGSHQLVNAAVAIGLVESLRFYDIILPYKEIREGIKEVRWPGRLQVLKREPCMVLDGAQNRASAKALKEAIKKFFDYEKLILVLGISKDKDIKGICKELVPISKKIILTKANLPRAEEPAVLRNYVPKGAMLTNSVREAIDMAEKTANPSDLILITGSLFVVGEALAIKKDLCGNLALMTQ